MSTTETPVEVIKLLTVRQTEGKAALLANVEDLRRAIESGEIVAWCGVGICANDETLQWQASAGGVTNLRLVGAVARLLHGVQHDIDEA